MEFAKQFNEAAQKAVLSAVESGEWVNYSWMEALIKQSVREGLKAEVTSVSQIIFPEALEEIAKTTCSASNQPMGGINAGAPRSLCGCQVGFCTCNTTITEPPACKSRGPRAYPTNDSFESNDFTHVEGYDYRIIVSDRQRNHNNSWAEHFSYKPTQEEFEHQFRHFHDKTHYVHVNQWVNGDWITITTDYVPKWNKEKQEETFTATEEWPEGKNYRIKFFDQRVNGYNYVYFESKPGGIVLSKYHSKKCFAVVQARPEGV